MSLTISYDTLSGDIQADHNGDYRLTVFGFITGYRGIAKLIVDDNGTEKIYTSHTNELGAVGFHLSGRLPEGQNTKNYPVMIQTPVEKQRSFFTVRG